MDFFKIEGVVVDVEDGAIFTPDGKVMRLNFINMTMKPFNAQSKLLPIRFNDNRELLMWESIRNKWVPLKQKYEASVIKAVNALVEKKMEKELLG
jgi:hypothetical protein